MPEEIKRRVLFVCVENRFRSQVAEAYFNRYAPEGWVAVSAGIRPSNSVHPKAVELMLEEGIDISAKKPRYLTRELQEEADLAVIVCSGDECPVVFAKKVLVWGIPDPADKPYDEAKKLRDEIKTRVLNLIKSLKEGAGS
ncbi:MAG: arsenate reductase ArsC [Nitrososphaerota archaeon]|nr:arsenate reductase ArsC [Candidatus Calditenuaceae archaeon]MDW8073022.1 arsenate reductase ArsC [Nitrososphaerota archaeon]